MVSTATDNEVKLTIALSSMKRQLTRTLRNNLNTHAIAFPKGIKYVAVDDDEDPDAAKIRSFLVELSELLDDTGKDIVGKILKRGMEVNKDIRAKIAELVLLETFRVDDAADVMKYEGADRYLNRLYDVTCRHNEYKSESTDYKLWNLTNEQSQDTLTVPQSWEKAKFTLREFKSKSLPLEQPTIIILPGLTTSNPALIGSTDPENPDEANPLASVITRHAAISGVTFGNAKDPMHNTKVLFMTHGDDYAKLQSWFDITKHNEDIKAGKPLEDIHVSPRITAFVEKQLRPLYLDPQGKKRSPDEIKRNFSKLMFIGYSAGSTAASMITIALGRDMQKHGFNSPESKELLPYLHVLNIATVSNPLAMIGTPTTLSIQNETDRYAHLSEFQHSFPKAGDQDMRSAFHGKDHLLLLPKDPGDCYPSYIISNDGSSRKMRYREDMEKHNAPSLLARPMIQANGDGIEIRPPVENPGSLMTHYFIADWHERACDTQIATAPPSSVLEAVNKRAVEFEYGWMDRLRQKTLPGVGDGGEPSIRL